MNESIKPSGSSPMNEIKAQPQKRVRWHAMAGFAIGGATAVGLWLWWLTETFG